MEKLEIQGQELLLQGGKVDKPALGAKSQDTVALVLSLV